jgi:hypothetical protein
MSKNLYELCKELENFEFCFDEETGELLNDAELDLIELERNEKIENCIKFYKNAMAEAEALANEKQKFAERQKKAQRQAENMKKWINLCLNGEKWASQDKLFKVSYRKSEVVEVSDDAILPEEFVKYEPKIDKAGIKKAVKNGAEFKGVELVEKQNIQIV